MSVSALSMLDKGFGLREPTPSMAQVTRSLQTGRSCDVNGNNLSQGVCPSNTSDMADSKNRMGAEWQLADSIDRLTLDNSDDQDEGLLDEYGAGYKRTKSQAQHSQDTDSVPSKRPLHREARPPPAHPVPTVQHSSGVSLHNGVDSRAVMPAAVHSYTRVCSDHQGRSPSGQSPPAALSDLPSDVCTDGAPEQSEKGKKIQEIIMDLMSPESAVVQRSPPWLEEGSPVNEMTNKSTGARKAAPALYQNSPPWLAEGPPVSEFSEMTHTSTGREAVRNHDAFSSNRQTAPAIQQRSPPWLNESSQASEQGPMLTIPTVMTGRETVACGSSGGQAGPLVQGPPTLPPTLPPALTSSVSNLPLGSASVLRSPDFRGTRPPELPAVGPPVVGPPVGPPSDIRCGPPNVSGYLPAQVAQMLPEGVPAAGVISGNISTVQTSRGQYQTQSPLPRELLRSVSNTSNASNTSSDGSESGASPACSANLADHRRRRTRLISSGMSGGSVTCNDVVALPPDYPAQRRNSNSSSSKSSIHSLEGSCHGSSAAYIGPGPTLISNVAHRGQGHAPVSNVAHAGPCPAPITNLAHTGPGPAPVSNVSHTGQGPAPITNLAHTGQVPTPITNLAHTGPGPAPASNVVHTRSGPLPPGQVTHRGASLGPTSPYTYQGHGSPGNFSFPPTPESDCMSGKDGSYSPRSMTGDSVTTGTVDSPYRGTRLDGSVVSMVNHSPQSGEPTSPGFSGVLSPQQSPPAARYPIPVPVLQGLQLPANFLTPAVDHVTPGHAETDEEEEEVEEILRGNRMSAEVVDTVCDENGVWLQDMEGEGDTFLHSLSGMEKEAVAVEYLHRLRHKPRFLAALNSYNKGLETPLYNAVCLGKRRLVEAMLTLGADVNRLCRYEARAHTALHKAVENSDTDMVETLLRSQLLEINAEQSSDKCTALMVALMKHIPGHPRQDRLDIVRLIADEEKLELKAKDQKSGKTALMMAVETKDIRIVNLLLEQVDADTARQLVNMQNRAGNSALHLAAGLRDVAVEVKEQILRKLIMSGGETNKRNNEGETPRTWASRLIDSVAKLR